MHKFTLFWRDGTKEVVEGTYIGNAFTRAGYGQGVLKALDFYHAGVSDDYQWNASEKKWVPSEDLIND